MNNQAYVCFGPPSSSYPLLVSVEYSKRSSSAVKSSTRTALQRTDYKILTYKVLTTTQPSYLHNLISVQPNRKKHSFFRCHNHLSPPPSSTSRMVNNRSFRHASPCLWNQLPNELAYLLIIKTYHSYLI